MATKGHYTRPYLDAAIFISWLKGDDDGPLSDGSVGNRSPISEHIIGRGEGGAYPLVTSYFTMAEVFKKKGDKNQALTDAQNGQIVKYFENEWIEWVPCERKVGEKANELLVRFRQERLRPCDAIHLASALLAKCDVLLTWDGPLTEIQHQDIRIERPEVFAPPPPPPQTGSLFEFTDGEA